MSRPQASSRASRRLERAVVRHRLRQAGGDLRPAWPQTQMRHPRPGAVVQFENYWIRTNDGASVYVGVKDIFVGRIHHFETRQPKRVILDCDTYFTVRDSRF
jgi:hypothetical protein